MRSNASLAALAAVVLIGMTGFGVFLPIFPFLALHLGATATITTIAMGAYSLGQFLASPFWGRLSDRVGRKPILIIGLVGNAVSYLILARAENIEMLGGARLFGGFMAGNVGAAFAAAADLADDKTRARNMGILGAAVGLAFIAGPALGAAFIGAEPGAADFERVCFISAGLAGLAALAALVFFKETLPKPARRARHEPRIRRTALLLSRPLLTRLVLVTLLMITAQALMEATFGLWADAALGLGPRDVGWALAALGLGSALLQGGGAGRAAKMLGEHTMLLIGLVLTAASFGGLAVAETLGGLSVSLLAMVVGFGLSAPGLNALIAAQAEPMERGVVMGLSQSASALGRVLGPFSAGILFDLFGHSAPFVAAALLILGALFVAMGGGAPAQSGLASERAQPSSRG